jgi:hypothetical protein
MDVDELLEQYDIANSIYFFSIRCSLGCNQEVGRGRGGIDIRDSSPILQSKESLATLRRKAHR